MQNFRSTLGLLVAGACCMAPGETRANQLMREGADISLIDGNPAICIPKNASGSFPLYSLLLMELRTPRGGRWSVRLKDGTKPMKLHPGECVSYGSIPDGYQLDPGQGDGQSFPLEKNRIYYFTVSRTGPFFWFYQTGIYESTFCLVEDADGALSIQQESACPGFSQ